MVAQNQFIYSLNSSHCLQQLQHNLQPEGNPMRLTATTIAIFSLVSIGLGLVCLTIALLLASPAHAASANDLSAPFVLDAYGLVSSLVAAALCGSAMVLLGLRIRSIGK
jgi:hypothetical protein